MPEDFETRLSGHRSTIYQRLRPAQLHVLREYVDKHLETRDLAIELPTGVGKTLIALLLADFALDRSMAVAYLTGTKQLAEQVQDQASGLASLPVARFYGGHYPGGDLDDYHQAQAVGVMNYWVYFNSSPKVQPADLVIFDDAHLAEQPLTSLSSLRIGRESEKALYNQLCDLVLAHSRAYAGLQAMRDGTAPGSTPPELLAFNDWSQVVTAATDAIDSSPFVTSGDGQFVWTQMRQRLERCGVLIGPSAIEVRPYLPPTRVNRWYSSAKQRIYLSATLGSMEDLQRRLGVEPVTAVDIPSALHREATGRRLLLLNPTSDAGLSPGPLAFALEQAKLSGRVAWLCASHYEADQVQGHLRDAGLRVYRLIPGDDAELERWLSSPAGHLIAAGRYDGLDLAGDVCRLVILPSVPSASTEFERFVVAYLGDAGFMRHRIGQRVTQALGRANRMEQDWSVYLGLDPAFASVLAQPDVRQAMGRDVNETVRAGLELHGGTWVDLEYAAQEFRAGVVPTPPQSGTRPGRGLAVGSSAESASLEVEAATALWLGDVLVAADKAKEVAEVLAGRGETEHAAFWRYVEAQALHADGRPATASRGVTALRDAISGGPRTPWFIRLRRTLEELEGRPTEPGANDALFLAWDDWIREADARLDAQLTLARRQISGTHNEQASALVILGRLCGSLAELPQGASATDARWTWVTPHRAERRVWEVKTGTGPDAVPRAWVNQLLGQLQIESQDHPQARVVGCLLTPLSAIEDDAAEAARERIAIVAHEAVVALLDALADRLRQYAGGWGTGTARERGQARAAAEPRLPTGNWLAALLAPSQGRVIAAQDVQGRFRD